MIQNISLKNFTIFNTLDVQFSPKINIIIGENGTGKTHLLKAVYSLCAGKGSLKDTPEVSREDLERAVTDKLEKTLMPLDAKLGKLHKYGAKENAEIKADFISNKSLYLTFRNNSKTVSLKENQDYQGYTHKPVFIPTKEVLSFMEGFVSLYNEFKLSFDVTYCDLISQLQLPLAQESKLSEKSRWAIDQIENILGGKFIFHGGGRVTFKSAGNEYSANAVAEGFRKIGVLSRLLETRAIQPGISGPLLWDEPEANMHPRMVKYLVEILLELSRNGQQIILVTHDYVFLKWFDLLMEKGKEDHVRFVTLYHGYSSGAVECQMADDYREIDRNAISAVFSELYDADIDKSFGDI